MPMDAHFGNDRLQPLHRRRIRRGSRSKTGTNARDAAVAVAYPKIPMSKAGTTRAFHPLACAMAAAVVGPPTHAFEAKYNSRNGRRRRNLPNPTSKAKCNVTCKAEYRKREGACRITRAIDPDAPDAAKNN